MSQTLKLGIKQKRKRPSLQKLHQDITSWKSKNHTAQSNGSKATSRSQIITARVSTIINAAVEVVTGSPQVGECYVAVFLEDSDQIIKGLVCRGYIYDLNPVSGNGAMVAKEGDQLRIESLCSIASVTVRVRGSQLRNQVIPGGWTGTDKSSTEGPGAEKQITGTNPAVGTNGASITVSDNRKWRLISDRFSITTNATVADRLATLSIAKGGTILHKLHAYETLPASSIGVFNEFISGHADKGIGGQAIVYGFIPTQLFLNAGDVIDNRFNNFQSGGSGDDVGPQIIYVEEWLIP